MTDSALMVYDDPLSRPVDEREDDLRRVMELYTRGFTIDRIASELVKVRDGYSERVARLDLMAVKERWATSLPISPMAAAQEELAANEALLAVAWENYREAESNLARADYLTQAEEDADNPSGETTFSSNVPVRMTNAGRNLNLRIRSQAAKELETWWDAIIKLRTQRAQLLGLVSGGISVNIDQRQVNVDSQSAKVAYVGWTPEEWDRIRSEASAENDIVDGEVDG